MNTRAVRSRVAFPTFDFEIRQSSLQIRVSDDDLRGVTQRKSDGGDCLLQRAGEDIVAAQKEFDDDAKYKPRSVRLPNRSNSNRRTEIENRRRKK